jgi:hypothetical protein
LVESGRVHGSGIAVLAADISNRRMTLVSFEIIRADASVIKEQ